MCGIGALYGFNNTPAGDVGMDEQAMLHYLQRRGPDGKGRLAPADNALLLHTRLAIVDTDERALQPLAGARWTLAFNGEIINYRGLKEALAGQYDFQTTSDTEVLLACLEVHGLEGTLARIAGMFAFVAHDRRSGMLYAARDPLGVKPLYYHDSGDFIVFGSTVKAVTASLPDVCWRENKLVAGLYFSLGCSYGVQSMVSMVEKVPAATWLAVSPDGRVQSKKYWTPVLRPDFTLPDMIAIMQEYQHADVKSSLFLSGGVDSSFLAGIFTPGYACFHLASPEQQYAEDITRLFEHELTTVEPQTPDYLRLVADVTAYIGQPYFSLGVPAAVSSAVSAQGIKMAVSANGADELFLGYPHPPRPEADDNTHLFMDDKPEKYTAGQLAHIFRDKRNFLLPAFDEHIPAIAELMTLFDDRLQGMEGFPPSARHRWLELQTYVEHDLNPTLDAASMYHGLEMRVPFLDHRVVEGVLSWDANVICDARLGVKAPMKKHLHAKVPSAFFNRPKLGFSLHKENVNEITRLGEAAFDAWLAAGEIRETGFAGPYKQRDRIYLGNAIYHYQAWRAGSGIRHE